MPSAMATSDPCRISSRAGTDSTRKPRQPAAMTGRRPKRSVSRPANGWTPIIRTITAEHDQQPVRLVVLQLRGQIARHVRQQHVVGDVEDQDQSDAQQQRPPLTEDHLADADPLLGLAARLLLRPRLLLQLREGRGLFEPHPQVEADDAHRAGDQERDAPAPGVQVLGGQQRGHQRDQAGAADVAGQGAELQPAAEESALLVGRVLGDEGGGAAVLAAGGEALHQAGDEQQDRAPRRRWRRRTGSGRWRRCPPPS